MLKGRSCMRVAAIDLGAARVGLAVSDDLGLLAHPRPALDGRDTGRLLDALCELVGTDGISTFVIGLPRHMDGREGARARASRRFAEILERRSGVPVRLFDERWSTVEAAARLRDQGLNSRNARGRLDSASAAVMLQCWLDSKCSGEGH